MSLSKLPVELKRIVVKHAHQSDLNYQHRHRVSAKGGNKTQKAELEKRGRSIHALSLVNKEWRLLTVEVLFSTLRSSKAKGPIFDGSIRGTTLGNAITTLVIGNNEPRENLATLVFYILPLLPNIRTVSTRHRTVLDKSASSSLYGDSAMGSHVRLISNEFEKFAKDRATGFDVHVESGWKYRPIIFANRHTLRSLRVETGPMCRIPLLETSDSKFARQLSQCTSLETLKLTTTRHNSYAFETPLVHDHTLSLTFASAATLRSLELNYKNVDLDCSLLSFANLFGSLEYLGLSGDDLDLTSHFLPVKLAELKYLDIANLNSLFVSEAILNYLSTSNLIRLDVQINAANALIPFSEADDRWPHLDSFAASLDTAGIPRTSCYLHHPVGIGKVEFANHLFGINFDWDNAAFEASLVESNSQLHSSTPEDDTDVVTKALKMAIDESADWAKEEAKTLTIADDRVGLKDPRQQLRGVNELKKDKED
ncbi:uncharacterized protein JCM6883_006670 [Sporobolomyces salmoneus]|uniref:uncharacterized protein n=1 Tax=Sporobolomyces salmoneus TaxID=183962 RepID=UPI00317B8E2F